MVSISLSVKPRLSHINERLGTVEGEVETFELFLRREWGGFRLSTRLRRWSLRWCVGRACKRGALSDQKKEGEKTQRGWKVSASRIHGVSVFRFLPGKGVEKRPERKATSLYSLVFSSFVFSSASCSRRKARISSAMSSSFDHCSLYKVTGKRPRP